MSWRPARSIDTLLAEVNAAAPGRSRASDGTVGDLSHQARPSDHNPNPAGVVRATDITDDDAGGCDARALAEAIRQLGIAGHPALGPGAYVISEGRIASATYGWAWRTYTGSNGHYQHVHVSAATAATGYDSTAPWGVMKETDDMAEHAQTLELILKTVRRTEVAQTELAAKLETVAAAEQLRDRASWRREAAMAKKLKDLGVDVDQLLAAADQP